jgi:hypothetical protein
VEPSLRLERVHARAVEHTGRWLKARKEELLVADDDLEASAYVVSVRERKGERVSM